MEGVGAAAMRPSMSERGSGGDDPAAGHVASSPHERSPHKEGAGFPGGADFSAGTDFRSFGAIQPVDASSTAAWREKAGAFFSSSSLKLRTVASKAGVTVAEAAGGAGVKMKDTWQAVQPKMAEVASKAGASVKGTWETTKDSWTNKVAPRMEAGISVAVKSAADTGQKLRQGLLDTTEKVKSSNLGQRLGETMRAEAATDGTSVFGVPLEVVAARGVGGPSPSPVPSIVRQCCDYLLQHGLHTAYLFESEGNPSVVKQIMKGFDEEKDMTIPDGTAPLDVAQLVLVYFKCLPEPLLTHRLYSDFVSFGCSDIQHLSRLLKTLPTPNLETLHMLLGLLHRVSQNCDENKMDAQSLAAEFAPVLLWREGTSSSQATDESHGNTGTQTKGTEDIVAGSSILSPAEGGHDRENTTSGHDGARVIVDVDGNVASTAEIPLDNDEPTHEQTSVVEAVMVLIEQYESIFSRDSSGPVMLPEMSL